MSRPTDDDRTPTADGNPFPSRAAADTRDLTSEVVTVQTPAISDAKAALDDYLGHDGPGAALVVTGEHGTGKTHLAAELMRIARASDDVRFAYVEAEEGGFVPTYRGNFLLRFNREDVVGHVRRYYADIVADSLASTGFPDTVITQLRDAEIDPARFVSRFNLAESTFLDQLDERLARVTQKEEFGTALMLLLRGEFSDMVWEWLRGEPPGEVLRERGITSSIDGEVEAVEAMSVLAMLYRERARRFVLVIDEMHKLLPNSSDPPPAMRTALLSLIGHARERGIFLVLSGLPEFRGLLGDKLDTSIDAELSTDEFSEAQVRSYIERSIAQTRNGVGLGPFTAESARFITAVAGGNARRIIQICRAAYRESLVTEMTGVELVEHAIRGRFQQTTVGAVQELVKRELQSRDWFVRTDDPVAGADGPRVPIWVPITDNAGCAVFFTDSMIRPTEATRKLIADADAVSAALPDSMTMLVVNGFVSDDVRRTLADHFSVPPLMYHGSQDFNAEFHAQFGRIANRLETLAPAIQTIKNNIRRLSGTQNTAVNMLKDLTMMIEATRAATEKNTALVRGLLAGEAPPRPLPPDVDAMFSDLMDDVQSLVSLYGVLDQTFGEGRADVDPHLLFDLDNPELIRAFGVASLAERTVAAFKEAVHGWYLNAGDSPTPEEGGRLQRLCRSYGTIIEALPLHTLGLATAGRQASGSFGGPQVRGLRQLDVATRLTDLGHDVGQYFAARGAGG